MIILENLVQRFLDVDISVIYKTIDLLNFLL